ncbi:hypothetical protein D521_1665 [beta proteobacterium CB]|nr:hypothetical protein D521_1665 [beta proteobacterium CB]
MRVSIISMSRSLGLVRMVLIGNEYGHASRMNQANKKT